MGKITIYKKKFFSKRNRKEFIEKLHSNRIVSQYEYIDHKKNKIFVVEYYRDTKYLRNKFGFESPIF